MRNKRVYFAPLRETMKSEYRGDKKDKNTFRHIELTAAFNRMLKQHRNERFEKPIDLQSKNK
jgi:hypothetical protein